MYLDTEGKVTVGMGHQIAEEADVVALPFHRRIPMGEMKPLVYADADDKRRAWRAVRERQDLKGSDHTKFKELTRLDLSDGEIWTLAMNDIEEVGKQLRHSGRFAKMSTYPRAAQLGLYDMGYNLGVHQLVDEFVKFTPAVQHRDCSTAPSEERTRRCARCSRRR